MKDGDVLHRFQAFRHVMYWPVMWPGVIQSFLVFFSPIMILQLRMLLSSENQMVPRIASFLGSVREQGNVMFAVAAVVSAIVPLFFLVLFLLKREWINCWCSERIDIWLTRPSGENLSTLQSH